MKEYIICERDMAIILEKNGWYTLWSNDYWLEKAIKYSNPDMAGVNIIDAFNKFKRINPKSDEIINKYLKNLYKL